MIFSPILLMKRMWYYSFVLRPTRVVKPCARAPLPVRISMTTRRDGTSGVRGAPAPTRRDHNAAKNENPSKRGAPARPVRRSVSPRRRARVERVWVLAHLRVHVHPYIAYEELCIRGWARCPSRCPRHVTVEPIVRTRDRHRTRGEESRPRRTRGRESRRRQAPLRSLARVARVRPRMSARAPMLPDGTKHWREVSTAAIA